MNPRYSLKVEFYVGHGNDEPTSAQMSELAKKVDTMTQLLFGDKILALPEVHLCEDEEYDYTVYATVQATLAVNLTVTSDCEHNASCIAEGLIDNLADYLDVNNDNCGVELAGTTINKVSIHNVEQDSPQGENG